ncbi:MAG: hypothetical protein ABIJ12_10715 [bacterium]
MKKSILLLLVVCSSSIFLFSIISCNFHNYRDYKDLRYQRINRSNDRIRPHVPISLSDSNSINLVNSNQELNVIIANQIDPIMPYFSKLNYARFSSNSVIDEFEFYSSIVPDPDLWIDYRLLNDFILVFTKIGDTTVHGYIKQIKNIETPLRNGKYLISDYEMKSILEEGLSDVYGFHNDTLVFKNTYSPFILNSYQTVESNASKKIDD